MTGVDDRTSAQPDQTEVELDALRAQLWARAHHEAAHAVVGTLLGARVLGVDLWSGPPVGGRVEIVDLDDDVVGPSDHGLVRRIAYQLAGPIAEQIASSPMGMIQNEAASFAATTVMLGLRDPASIEQGTDLAAVAALIADYFGPDGEGPAAAAADNQPCGRGRRSPAVERGGAGSRTLGRGADGGRELAATRSSD
jgi:hypothetical protein